MRLCVECQNCGLCDWALKENKKKLWDIVKQISELELEYYSKKGKQKEKSK